MTDTLDQGEPRTPEQPGRRDLQRNSDFLAALLAMAGHDLRQPLQVIMGAHARLAHRLTAGPEQEYVARGQRGVAQLRDQLDLLVHALRLYENAGIRATPVPLRPRFASLAEEHTPAAQQKGVGFRIVDADRVILSDALLLDGILRNLVRNALRYTRTGGQILVGCRRRGAALRIEVHDTGIGISPNNLARIFGAFQKAGASPSEGLGLGLFIVKHAADALGHRIEVTSTLDRGSCFSVLADTVSPAQAPNPIGSDRRESGTPEPHGASEPDLPGVRFDALGTETPNGREKSLEIGLRDTFPASDAVAAVQPLPDEPRPDDDSRPRPDRS